jgi:hypothetical protein
MEYRRMFQLAVINKAEILLTDDKHQSNNQSINQSINPLDCVILHENL